MIKQLVSVFIILTTVLVCSSCTSDENISVDLSSLSLTKVDSVILENSEPLFGKLTEQFRVNTSGDIWVFAESNQDRIFAFDSLGQFKHVLGERGKGPKGIVRVGGFDIDDNNQVIIYDAAQQMLKIFDLTGELIHSTPFLSDSKLWVHPYGLHAFGDKFLVSVTENKFIREPHKSKLLALVGYDGTVDTVFGKHDIFTTEDNSYSAENTLFNSSDTVYASSVGSPYIQVYDSRTFQQTNYFGEKSASFSIPEKEVHAGLPISEINKRYSGSSVLLGVYGTNRFIVSHMQILTEEFFEATDFSKKKNILVIYDRQTKELIKEIPVSHTLGAVHDNKLYFIEDFNPDNYTIGIYEFTNQE